MDSSSGTSSNSSGVRNSGLEEDLQHLMDQRKRKRMISNRESARRSRLRKQKHLDELIAEVAQLRKENHQILTGLNLTTQHYINVEAENTILRGQAAELSSRLLYLEEIVSFLTAPVEEPACDVAELTGFVNYPWNCFAQPMLMAAAAPADSAFQC